jgi:hypothetical protein
VRSEDGIGVVLSSRFSKSQRSGSSCLCSMPSGTSSTLLELAAWSCLRILASKDASRIFDGHGSLLAFESTGKSGVNQQNLQRGGTVESHVSQRT